MDKEYIEREAAKRELLSWAVSINHPEYLIKDDALHIIDSFPAADVVEQEQESKPLNGWISVQDRLPEIPEGLAESPEPVLYMMKNTKTIYAGYYGEGGVWRDKYFRQYSDRRNGVDADDVTFWMYQCDLPQPPKGE